MAKNLFDNPKYMFAVAFLTWVDQLNEALYGVSEEDTSLAILKELVNYPQKAVTAAISDTLSEIFSVTDEWDAARILAADNILRSHSAITLSEARATWKVRRHR